MKNNKSMLKRIAFIGVAALLVFIVSACASKADGGNKSAGADIKILKSEVTETAKFYPYNAGKTNMEVIAVKASDGSIRTALNTCQVCYDSGKGYYKQQGNELVCQNCGNKFKMDQLEKVRGGCNPVPVMKENKTEDDTSITVSKDFLEKNKELFANWKKQ